MFLNDLPDHWAESHRLADLRLDFMDEAGVSFDAKPYAAVALGDRTALMHEIRKDGLDF